ncbi:MAG: glycosyltransferase family 1 protein [Daejeonella sp.]
MKLGFDGKRALQNFTGLGNYSRYILEILSAKFPQNQYLVYCPKKQITDRTKHLYRLKSVVLRFPESKALKSFWRSFGIIKDLQKDNVQLYHGLSNEIPFGISKAGIKSIVTIHDLIYIRFPQFYPLLDRKIYAFKFKFACKNADKIIAISEQTKKDIIQFFGIPANKIEVIYQNCSSIFSETKTETELLEIAAKYSLPSKYLLSVGSIETRKNLLLIVKSLTLIPTDIHLVVVGKETAYTKIVKDYIASQNLVNRVHFLKNIPFSELPGIYQLSEIFIYPSRFEGFGIPIIEALQSGVPVIAATGSCLEEAGGPDSRYIHPDNEKDLADTINFILGNPDEKHKMIESGKEYAKRFADEIIAGQLIELYQNTLRDA